MHTGHLTLRFAMMALFTLIVVTVALTASPSPPRETVEPPLAELDRVDMDGYYTCSGTSPAGDRYAGQCRIYRNDDFYIVTWSIDGAPVMRGLGLRDGNTLAVAWALVDGNGKLLQGINRYTFYPATRRLVGRWVTIPGGAVCPETLRFLIGTPDTPDIPRKD